MNLIPTQFPFSCHKSFFFKKKSFLSFAMDLLDFFTASNEKSDFYRGHSKSFTSFSCLRDVLTGKTGNMNGNSRVVLYKFQVKDLPEFSNTKRRLEKIKREIEIKNEKF